MSLEACFKGKRVLVTGAGRGIGRSVAERLHQYGALVYALSRNPNNLKELEKQCPGIQTIAVDLDDWNATKKAVEAIAHSIEYLINNAAIFIPEGFLDIKPESFDMTFSTNVKAVLNVSQVVAKQMIESKIQGSIVNISSMAGLRPIPNIGTYCSSKAALDMLTKTMALELGKYKIRANFINMASVDTDMFRSASVIFKPLESSGEDNLEVAKTSYQNRAPMGEIMIEMDQVVNAVLFTASNLVRMMDGHGLVVDGGYMLS